jgi:hypothetical protein
MAAAVERKDKDSLDVRQGYRYKGIVVNRRGNMQMLAGHTCCDVSA